MSDASPRADRLIYAPLIGYPSDVPPIVITPNRLVEAPVRGYGSSPREVVSLAHQLAADFANAIWSQSLQGQAMPTTAEELLARCQLPYGISLHRGDGQLLPLKVLAPDAVATSDAGWIRFDGELLEIDLADGFYRPGIQQNYCGPLLPVEPPPAQDDSILIAALQWAPHYQRARAMHLAGFTGAGHTKTSDFRTYLSWESTTPTPPDYIPEYAESLQPAMGLRILAEYYKQLDFNLPGFIGKIPTSLADVLLTGQPLLVPCDADGVPYELVDPETTPEVRPRTVRWSYADNRMSVEVVDGAGHREELMHGSQSYRSQMMEFAHIQPADPGRVRVLEFAIREGTLKYVKLHRTIPTSWAELCRECGIAMRHHTWLSDDAPLPADDARTVSLRLDVCESTGDLRSILWDGVMRTETITPAGDPTVDKFQAQHGRYSTGQESDADMEEPAREWRCYGVAEFDPVVRADPTLWIPEYGMPVPSRPARRAPMMQASWEITTAWFVWIRTYGAEPTSTRDLMEARSLFFTERETDGSAHPIVPIPPPVLPPIPPGRDRHDPDTWPRPPQFVPEFSSFTAYWVDEQVGIASVTRDSMTLQQYWLTLPESKWRKEHLESAQAVVAHHEPIATLRPRIMAQLKTAIDLQQRSELVAEYLAASDQLNEHRLEAALTRCKDLFEAYLMYTGRFPASWDEVMDTLEMAPRDLIYLPPAVDEDSAPITAPDPRDWFVDREPMRLSFYIHRDRRLLMVMLKPTLPAALKYGYVFDIEFARGHVAKRGITPADSDGIDAADIEVLFEAIVPTDPLPEGA